MISPPGPAGDVGRSGPPGAASYARILNLMLRRNSSATPEAPAVRLSRGPVRTTKTSRLPHGVVSFFSPTGAAPQGGVGTWQISNNRTLPLGTRWARLLAGPWTSKVASRPAVAQRLSRPT